MTAFRIKEWSSYQSYKDRNPPWIRLHKKLLDDRIFQKMSVESRALLPMLWLIASEDSNPVTGLIRGGYEEISFRLRMPEEKVIHSLKEILDAGFIIEISPVELTSYETDTIKLRNCHPETE